MDCEWCGQTIRFRPWMKITIQYDETHRDKFGICPTCIRRANPDGSDFQHFLSLARRDFKW